MLVGVGLPDGKAWDELDGGREELGLDILVEVVVGVVVGLPDGKAWDELDGGKEELGWVTDNDGLEIVRDELELGAVKLDEQRG